MWYLGITTTRLIAPFPGAEKIRGEWAVKAQLEALGIEAHAPEKITFRRSGKKRRPEPVHEVALPGYIFADIPAEKYFRAIECTGLSRTLMAVHPAEVRAHVQPFIAEAARKAAEAHEIIERNDRTRMAEYSPGDALSITTGPFAGQIVQFRRMVESAGATFPEIEAEAELFGRATRVKIDPLDVRKAG